LAKKLPCDNLTRLNIYQFFSSLPLDLYDDPSRTSYYWESLVDFALGAKYIEYADTVEKMLRSTDSRHESGLTYEIIDYFRDVIGKSSIPLLGEALDHDFWNGGREVACFHCCVAFRELGDPAAIPYLERAVERHKDALTTAGRDTCAYAGGALKVLKGIPFKDDWDEEEEDEAEFLISSSAEYSVIVEKLEDMSELIETDGLCEAIASSDIQELNLLGRNIMVQVEMLEAYRRFQEKLTEKSRENLDALIFTLFWSSSDDDGRYWMDGDLESEELESCYSPERCGALAANFDAIDWKEVESQYPTDEECLAFEQFHKVFRSWYQGLKKAHEEGKYFAVVVFV